MTKIRGFFMNVWRFLRHGRGGLIGYLVVSVLVWNYFVLAHGGYKGMLGAGNRLAICFAVLGCLAGFQAASRFSSGKKGELFRSLSTETERPYVAAAFAELLKVTVSVWVTVYSAIPFAYALSHNGIVFDKIHKLAFMSVCYVILYFSVGLFAGGIAGRAPSRIAVCLSYYLLSAGINYYVFALSANVFRGVAEIRRIFAFNAPLLDYDQFMRMSGCTQEYIVENVFPDIFWDDFYFLSYDQSLGMVITACLFFAISILVFIKREESKSRDVFTFKGIGAAVTVLFTVELHYVINTGIISRWLRYLYSNLRFNRGLITYFLSDLPILICVFLVATLSCTCSLRGALKNLKLLPVATVMAYLIQLVTFWEDIF